MRRFSRTFSIAAVTLALFSSRARAGDVTDTDRQIAQSLFDEGRTLLEAGRAREACPKFAESQRLDPGGGTLLNLALCLELQGLTASAWTRYQESAALAVRDGRKDREEFARTHLAALTPTLTRIVVVVRDDVPTSDLVVELDGSRVAREAWGTAIAVDPGTHRVTAASGAARTWGTTVDATSPGRTYRVEVGVAEMASVPVHPKNDDAAHPTTTHRTAAFYGLLGGGAALVATGGVLGILALSADKDAQSGCLKERAFCTDDARAAGDRATRLAWISTGLMVGGAAAGALAFVLPLEVAGGRATVAPSPQGAVAHFTHRF